MNKDTFLGREQILELLEKRVKGLQDGYRQNIAFLGHEAVGKTAVIFQFLSKFCNNQFVPVYLELHSETLASFCRRFIGVLLYSFLQNSNAHLREDLDFLITKAAPYLPQTSEKIKHLLSNLGKRKKEGVITQLLSLCDTFYAESRKFVVVIFDEFQYLESLGYSNVYKEWSQLLMTQKTTMYIIVSSQPVRAQSVLARNLSLLFGNFEVVTIEPLDIRVSSGLLDKALRQTEISPVLKNFLVNFTGGYPLYIDVFGTAISKAHHQDIVLVFEQLLFKSTGILNQRFQNILQRFSGVQCCAEYVKILYLVACGHNKIKDVAHMLKKKPATVRQRAAFLIENDVLVRNGDFLQIPDRVFNYWLKFVYRAKFESLTFDAVNQRLSFRKNIEAMVHEFASLSNRTVTERVTEMVRMFSDDRIQVEKKNLRLTHFREVKPVELGNRSLKEGLICRSRDCAWLIGVKHDVLTEEDIASFSRECKKYKSRLERKVIVALQGVDQNSRLRALEEKIWTWDLNRLNQMLDLFSKPRIVATE